MLSDPYNASEYIPEMGDRVRVKSGVLPYSGELGYVTRITRVGVYVALDNGNVTTYEASELQLVEGE